MGPHGLAERAAWLGRPESDGRKTDSGANEIVQKAIQNERGLQTFASRFRRTPSAGDKLKCYFFGNLKVRVTSRVNPRRFFLFYMPYNSGVEGGSSGQIACDEQKRVESKSQNKTEAVQGQNSLERPH